MKVSVVVSVYNEECVLNAFYEAFMDVFMKEEVDYELVFVNDGSTDSSQECIDAFTEHNLKVKSISFSRNFGHEAAMIAGIDYATGDVVICMDCDLQHPPTEIPTMINSFKEQPAIDIITMVRLGDKTRRSWFFYKFLNSLSAYKLEPNASDFFLISKRVANILRHDYRERVRFLRGFIQIIGFKKLTLTYVAPPRCMGKSKYSLRKLFDLSITAIATLSKMPLKIGIYLGFLSGLISVILLIYSVVMKIVQNPVSGYTTIVVFLSLMFSIQFMILGIIGEYIGFLFDEQKKRPIYIIDKTNNLTTE